MHEAKAQGLLGRPFAEWLKGLGGELDRLGSMVDVERVAAKAEREFARCLEAARERQARL